jgi:hypothetical protein
MGRFTGVIGIIIILGLAFLWSNNRKKINYRLVITGLLLQIALAVFILKVPIGQEIFFWLGKAINKLLDFSKAGGLFVFGDLTKITQILPEGIVKSGVFLFILLPTIIFVCVLVAIAYHIGLMQRVIAGIARFVHWAMRVSGSECCQCICRSGGSSDYDTAISFRNDNVRTAGIHDRKYGLYRGRGDGSVYFYGCTGFLSSRCKSDGCSRSFGHCENCFS